jgi:hypothetical protein
MSPYKFRTEAFKHITEMTMDQEADSPMLKALANSKIDNINGLLNLNRWKIETLQYDNNGTLTTLDPGFQNNITILIAYLCHCIRTDNPVGNNYLSITQNDFTKYRLGDYMLTNPATNIVEPNQRVTEFMISINTKDEHTTHYRAAQHYSKLILVHQELNRRVLRIPALALEIMPDRYALTRHHSKILLINQQIHNSVTTTPATDDQANPRGTHHDSRLLPSPIVDNNKADHNIDLGNTDDHVHVLGSKMGAKHIIPHTPESLNLTNAQSTTIAQPTLALQEHNKSPAQSYYNKYKLPKAFVAKLWPPDPLPPEPPPTAWRL